MEQERRIKENELNTEIAIEEKKRQIREAKAEADRLAEAKRAIPRMQRLGCKLIRIMSYAVLKNGDCDADDQMEQERFRRLREISFSSEFFRGSLKFLGGNGG